MSQEAYKSRMSPQEKCVGEKRVRRSNGLMTVYDTTFENFKIFFFRKQTTSTQYRFGHFPVSHS